MKGVWVRLTMVMVGCRSLFESRKQHAYSDKQTELLKQELHVS